MRVVIAAGGTAGHVVPALAVAAALRARGAQVTFLGTRERAEARLVPAAGYEIDFVSVSGLDRRNPLRAVAAVARVPFAVRAAARVLRDRGADAAMGGGGYVAGPAGVAAVLLGVPLVLTEADSHLGLANRLLARRARRLCLAFPIPGREGERYLVTGRPVPATILQADRATARRRFGIEPEEPCLLVFGGSLGARSINEAALAAFAGDAGDAVSGLALTHGRAAKGDAVSGLALTHGGAAMQDLTPVGGEREFHVLHIAGHRDYPEAAHRLQEAGAERYTLLEYEPDLGDALAACDLVLARAGGSVFELAAAGRPAILVPYPHAAAGHQRTNAAWMERAGAAVVMDDSELTQQRIAALATQLLADPDRLARMSEASRSLARPDAAERIAGEVLAACG